MHCYPNYKTKKALKEALAAGHKVEAFQPGPFPGTINGNAVIEGPHEYHRWYASVILKDGYIEKVVS